MSYAFSKPLFGRCVAALVFCEKLLTEPGRTCLTISGNVSVLFWDHPRTRGEKLSYSHHTESIVGSPPHTRGKAFRLSWLCFPTRITPAHAGKSFCCKAVHFVKVGSPPHTRGKVSHIPSPSSQSRITPAHAGKRREGISQRATVKDHPRTRGEMTTTAS